MPNLVLIIGTKATLYVDGQATQEVEIDYSQPLGRIKKDIEYFREHGLDFSPPSED